MAEQYRSKFWTQHVPVRNPIEYFSLVEDKHNQPIFVLDEDPKLCAKCFTTSHIKKYIEYIVYTIINYRGTETAKRKSEVDNKFRIDYMFYNQRTTYWFYTLYNEMQEIYKKRFGKYYKVTEYFQDTWINDLQGISGPMDIKHKAHKSAKLPDYKSMHKKYEDLFSCYKSTLNKAVGATAKFRVMYMLMGYLNSEFPQGAPAWYSNMKATIWKSFNKMTRLYYRIDTNIEGKYSYYYSADDKNWIEIQNIPLELRGLIDGIIFAREV